MATVGREQALRFRATAQQLGRPEEPGRPLTDATVLDLGVQATGAGGSEPAGGAHGWALAVRGVPAPQDPDAWSRDLALAWTVRGAPHAYRREDLPAVEVALRPFSAADAGKRILDANRPLRAAGITAPEALAHVATLMRRVVDRPRPKGEVSTRLTAALDAPYLRECRPCGTTHAYEQPFRLAALHAGLELEPGTSPPVLRRVPGWRTPSGGPRLDPPPLPRPERRGVAERTVARLDLVRTCVRLLGPTTPELVAGYLDAPVADVRERWPADVTPVTVVDERDGEASTAWVLTADLPALDAAAEPPAEPVVRLVGPFDLVLQARDRELLVPDPDQRAALWPTLGRPGAVVVDGEPVGLWRPRAQGGRLRVLVEPWRDWDSAVAAGVAEQTRALATHRALTPAG